jgi:molybdenum cofactor cytidylyltransferase
MSSQLSVRRIGVILAAGRGRRMGQTKQLIPWPSADGPKPLVAAAYDAIRSHCDEMVVVLGHDADAVAAALGRREFHSAVSEPDAPMFNSIRAGLETARAIDPHGVVVLQPGDHPEVSSNTVQALADHSCQRPAQAIIPEYRGRGGHPVFIPSVLIEHILHEGCPYGLGDFWKAYPQLCVRIPVDDAAICRDIDTPTDLA